MRHLIWLALIALLAEPLEGAENPREAFLGLLGNPSKVAHLPDDDAGRQFKASVRESGWQVLAEGTWLDKDCWLALAMLDDPKARPAVVAEIVKDPNGYLGHEVARSGSPDWLPDLAPGLLRQEEWRDLLLGSDHGAYPPSFEMAWLFVQLSAHATAFSPEVRSWAKRFGDYSPAFDEPRANETRDLVRQWWKENEAFIQQKDYRSVKPGRDPTPEPPPLPIVNVPMNQIGTPAGQSSTRPAAPIAPAAEKPGASSNRVWPLYVLGLLALIVAWCAWLRLRKPQ